MKIETKFNVGDVVYVCRNDSRPPKIEDIKDEIFTYPKYFVDIQRRLSKKFLAIKPKVNDNNREELDKELDELFANLGIE